MLKQAKPLASLLVALGIALGAIVPLLGSAGASASEPPRPLGLYDFAPSGVQGLDFLDPEGARHNSVAWSMQWWNNRLYVGTNRDWLCWSVWSVVALAPDLMRGEYPPADPDVQCTENPADLPLQAEIWRWTPPGDGIPPEGLWERVYRSDTFELRHPDPLFDRKPVARDIAYRGMAVFQEPGGEALYVAGVSARSMWNKGDVVTPPPRILRSTDGANFEPIPQTPGTVFGDIEKGSFRGITSLSGRLIAVHGSVQGFGSLYDSTQPWLGDDAWAHRSPEELKIFEIEPFNGWLYLGVQDISGGYTVMKTDLTIDRVTGYYFLQPVVPAGAYLPSKRASGSVVAMQAFDGRLYVGTADPSEIIRINPDDTWQLVIGQPRQAADGTWLYPIGGLDEGYNYGPNDHIWRMQEHEGQLYTGTYDSGTTQRRFERPGRLIAPYQGFDIYRSAEGIFWSVITMTGLGDGFNLGARTFASTPFGLFVGSANYYYGAWVYRGTPGARTPDAPEPPAALLVEAVPGGVGLTWDPMPDATQYDVYRTGYEAIYMRNPGKAPDEPAPAVQPPSDLPPALRWLLGRFSASGSSGTIIIGPDIEWVPTPPVRIGITSKPYFVDKAISSGQRYAYFVVSRGDFPRESDKSNLAAYPLKPVEPEEPEPQAAATTFGKVRTTVASLEARGKFASARAAQEVKRDLALAERRARSGDLGGAQRQLRSLQAKLKYEQPRLLERLAAQDLGYQVMKLGRRALLAQAGALPNAALR